ncbi:response regulator transcription factor [Winogradskyella jejuensis]|uniref:Regulatory protein, luxR family n=1 Tax=Winogradskyella jejuensis TaxID=1089305 RepID=A0A1M5KKL1_9FLAO|nr:helix-turn-helix transcriptional regulator [Winogradskyella jejuensis]SHG53384.1 regulatory protein, luxR family [Winogradskyella jejuensis]
MFGTEIHWTTFFYLLIDTVIVLFAFYQSRKLNRNSLKRFLYLGLLFIAYNASGGFLPTESFPGPLIIQYIITYGVAITLCVYIVYYLYKEYDFVVLAFRSSIRNLAIVAFGGFIILYLIPYFFTTSLNTARLLYTVPISIVAFIFLGIFYKRISHPKNPNSFIVRRNKLSIISVTAIALLPICTVIGDYQWITFTIMNIAFYAISVIEVDRHLFFLENKNKLYEVFLFNKGRTEAINESEVINGNLTRREIEIAVSILSKLSYKRIAEDLYIAESTVSKHASNIFKKTGVKNRTQFTKRFDSK